MSEPLLRRPPFLKPRPLFATCDAGLEEVLASELRAQGVENPIPEHRGVGFMGDPKAMWRANLECRVANRILLPLAEFNAATPDDLYEGVRRIDWAQWMQVGQTLAIDASTNRSQLENTAYIAQKAKDAICDRFREECGQRPSVDKMAPDIRINIHLEDDHAIVCLDSSGERLHRRGYRLETGDAPLKETLAAGILLLSGYDGKHPLLDPMCGSGTFPIEAALIARNVAPGLIRLREGGAGFGFQRWRSFNRAAFEEVVEDAYDRIVPSDHPTIMGSDIDREVLEKAKRNAERANVANELTFEERRLSQVSSVGDKGLFVVNPPYGHRLNRGLTLEGLYETLGDLLKQRFTGYRAAILASQDAPYNCIGLHSSLRHPLRNGPIECLLLGYEVYEGSKKGAPHGDRFEGRKQGYPRSSKPGIKPFKKGYPKSKPEPQDESAPSEASSPLPSPDEEA